MSAYYPDEALARDRPSRRTHYREERRDDRDPRYVDPRDNYLSVHSRDLVPRPREDSDLSVEEIHRDFPPPGYNTRDIRRARSAGHYDDYDDRRSHYSRDDRDYDRRSKKGSSVSHDSDRVRMLSKQEQIIAAVAGAAVAIGGKELYDRREAKQEGSDVHRNVLASAALGAAGALAGYQGTEFYNKHQKKSSAVAHRGRDGYDSDDDDDSKEKKGHKNFLEGALAAAGLGGAVKALTGGSSHDDKKSDTRSRRGSRSRSGSKGRGEGANKVQKAAMASLIAGATEAFRVSKEPGGWKGEKAKRILTAAAGAATIDAAQNPDKSNKLSLAESVIGGLVGNRVIHGSKKNIEEDKKTGRSRSRSRARSDGGHGGPSGLAALATAGLGAFGAKKIMDNRERSRSRRRSADSYDSRGSSPDRRQRRSRSRSVVDSARRSLAKIGIGNGPEEDDERDHHRDRRHRDDRDDPRGSRRHGRYDSDDDYDDYSRGGHGRDRGGRDYGDDRYGARERSRDRGGRRDRSRSLSESDLGDSDEDEKRAKKMRDGRRRH